MILLFYSDTECKATAGDLTAFHSRYILTKDADFFIPHPDSDIDCDYK